MALSLIINLLLFLLVRDLFQALAYALESVPFVLVVLFEELLINNPCINDLHGFELRSHHLDLVSDQRV